MLIPFLQNAEDRYALILAERQHFDLRLLRRKDKNSPVVRREVENLARTIKEAYTRGDRTGAAVSTKALQQQASEARITLEDREKELAAFKAELDQAHRETKGLRAQLDKAERDQKQQTVLEAALEKAKNDFATAMRPTEELRRKLTDADKADEVRAQLAPVQRERAVLEADLKRVTNDLAKATNEARELRRKLADADGSRNALAATTADLDRADAEVQSLQQQLAVERRCLQQRIPEDAREEPARHIDQDGSFQPGIIQLDQNLEVAGGLEAVEVAVLECVESVDPTKQPVLSIKVEELSDIAARIEELTAKKTMTLEERKERISLISKTRNYQLGNISHRAMYNDLAEILISRFRPSQKDYLTAAEFLVRCLRCVASRQCIYNNILLFTEGKLEDDETRRRIFIRDPVICLCYYNDTFQSETIDPEYVIPIQLDEELSRIRQKEARIRLQQNDELIPRRQNEELISVRQKEELPELVESLRHSGSRGLYSVSKETFWFHFAYPLTMGYVKLKYKDEIDVDVDVFFDLERWYLKSWRWLQRYYNRRR